MEHIIGRDRFQAFSTILEERIAADNPVRVIDAFVEVLSLEKMGFTKLKPVNTSRRWNSRMKWIIRLSFQKKSKPGPEATSATQAEV